MKDRMNMLTCNRWSILAIALMTLTLLLVSACAKPAPPPLPPANKPPTIQSVNFEKIGDSGKQFKVICQATDPDNDTMSYVWSADGGTIQGERQSITWTAPEAPGSYIVKVLVRDGKGGEATGATTINVADKPNQPPVIVKLTSEKTRIRVWTTTTIQCVAEDPDGDTLTYGWAAPKGKIQGEGSTVGWTAPGDSGEYTVTITAIVEDVKGGKATKSIDIQVFCCGSG